MSRSDQARAHDEETRRCRSATPTYPPEAFVARPGELLPRSGTPDTIAGWKALADGFLSDQACAFHRNVEISSRYAWMYQLLPACFKWAGMAAIASHHVRLALFPLRLDTDRSGYVNIPHSMSRRKWLLMDDVNTIRATNNAIFNDIFWFTSPTSAPRTGSQASGSFCERTTIWHRSCPASRRSMKAVVSWRTRQHPPRLGGGPTT